MRNKDPDVAWEASGEPTRMPSQYHPRPFGDVVFNWRPSPVRPIPCPFKVGRPVWRVVGVTADEYGPPEQIGD